MRALTCFHVLNKTNSLLTNLDFDSLVGRFLENYLLLQRVPNEETKSIEATANHERAIIVMLT